MSGPTSATEVSIASIEPVLARRIEHIHIEGVLEGQCPMRQVRWNYQDLARTHGDLFGPVLSQPKVQRTLEDIGDLFILVGMTRHLVALRKVDVRDHHALARNQSS